MTSDAAPPPPPIPEPIRISGKIFVPIFSAALAIAVVVAIVMAQRMRPVVEYAHGMTFPLQAQLTSTCREPGAAAPVDMHVTGRCTDAGTLELGVTEFADGVKNVAYAIVGEWPGEIPATGQFRPEIKGQIPLNSRAVGPHVAVYLISDKPLDLVELQSAIRRAPAGDVPQALVMIEAFATVERHHQIDVRTERLEFKVEDSKQRR